MLMRLPDKVRRAGSPCMVMLPEPLALALLLLLLLLLPASLLRTSKRPRAQDALCIDAYCTMVCLPAIAGVSLAAGSVAPLRWDCVSRRQATAPGTPGRWACGNCDALQWRVCTAAGRRVATHMSRAGPLLRSSPGSRMHLPSCLLGCLTGCA